MASELSTCASFQLGLGRRSKQHMWTYLWTWRRGRSGQDLHNGEKGRRQNEKGCQMGAQTWQGQSWRNKTISTLKKTHSCANDCPDVGLCACKHRLISRRNWFAKSPSLTYFPYSCSHDNRKTCYASLCENCSLNAELPKKVGRWRELSCSKRLSRVVQTVFGVSTALCSCGFVYKLCC